MKRITSQQAQRDLDKVIEEAAAPHEPVGIEGTNEQGVLVALADWNGIQETLYLLSVPECASRFSMARLSRSTPVPRLSIGK